MTYETLSYEREEGVATITLQRPEMRNAVNSVMNRELPEIWRHFEEDDEAVVAIVTGSGDKAFCTGADLSDMPQTDREGREATIRSIRWSSLQNDVWKPVICAVNGTTVGGGLHFVADSDIVLAADTATFFDTHVKVGLVAGLEPVCLARRMPMEAVLRMMLVGGGERMSADRAHELGMVGEVLPAAELMDRAREVAGMIQGNSPAAMMRTKQAIWRGADSGLREANLQGWELMMAQRDHPDIQEGRKAFLEKRPPQWRPYSEHGE